MKNRILYSHMERAPYEAIFGLHQSSYN